MRLGIPRTNNTSKVALCTLKVHMVSTRFRHSHRNKTQKSKTYTEFPEANAKYFLPHIMERAFLQERQLLQNKDT
ncbi:hypothetical protein Mapa_000325 [Marchantia paleacea]|nr:hypothetical protein Mapa_000325 [Marchantia paleacea]